MSDNTANPVAAQKPTVPLKNPVIAGILAFLVPGLGHYYQRRMFKAVLYFVCILGTFFTGLRIGHGQVVYFQWDEKDNKTYAYFCQVWAGVPALPALVQAKLRNPKCFEPNYLESDLNTTFRGTINDLDGDIEAAIVVPARGRGNEATLDGTIRTAQGEAKIEGTLTGCSFDPQVGSNPQRFLSGYFEGKIVQSTGAQSIVGRLQGGIPRPFWDWFEAPIFDNKNSHWDSLDRVHRELGLRFELGVVFTMIAGLLNVLAIFDAIDGPAYGDEEQPQGKQPDGAQPKVPSTAS